jgi:hypothetical protein
MPPSTTSSAATSAIAHGTCAPVMASCPGATTVTDAESGDRGLRGRRARWLLREGAAATGGNEMTQSSLSRVQAPGASGAAGRSTSRAAEARMRERSQAVSAAGEVHMWFAAPSASSRYLDIVLAARTKQPGS